MNKIITLNEIERLSNRLKEENKSIVLVGGCFDIFHFGHFYFLKKSKKLADLLIVALESDQSVRILKGKNRPVTPLPLRAELLANISFVDYVVTLADNMTDKSYQQLTDTVKPNVIAVTKGDRNLSKKEDQIKKIGGKLVVIPAYNTPSSSELLQIINKEI